MLQVGASRQLAVSDPGSAVFEGMMTGNGKFVTTAGAANTGSGVINAGSVTDPSQMNGQSYTLTFSVDAAGATTYLVTETPPPATPATPQPYVDGQNITVGGTQFAITGKPANGDTFAVNPSSDQSIFTTISNLIDALSSTASGSTNQTRLANALNTANNNIDNALTTTSTVRASIGSRLSEIDDLDSAGSDLGLQYTQTYKDLIEIDPAAAYSSFLQQSYTLDAARQTFMKVAGMSLFQFLQ
jgi:flagellar hook-associated protein 3 FlgL